MSEEIEQTFEKFRQGAVNDYRVRLREYADMNHVEAQILDLVAELHPETFAELEQYCRRNERYLDETVGALRPGGPVLPGLSRVHRAAEGERPGASRLPRVSARLQGRSHAARDLRPGAGGEAGRRRSVGGVQRLSPHRSRADPGGQRPQQRRQDHVRADVRPAALSRQPRAAGPGRRCSAVPARSDLHPLRARGGHRDPARASSRTSCIASTRSWSARRARAC